MILIGEKVTIGLRLLYFYPKRPIWLDNGKLKVLAIGK